MILREVVGDELRRAREQQNKSLRSVSRDAAISLSYLSEVERGLKEPSSEIISSITRALKIKMSDLYLGVSFELAKHEDEYLVADVEKMMSEALVEISMS